MGGKCKNWQTEESQKMFCYLSAYYVNFIFGFVPVICLGIIYFINLKIRKKQHIAIYFHLLYVGKLFLGMGSHIKKLILTFKTNFSCIAVLKLYTLKTEMLRHCSKWTDWYNICYQKPVGFPPFFSGHAGLYCLASCFKIQMEIKRSQKSLLSE